MLAALLILCIAFRVNGEWVRQSGTSTFDIPSSVALDNQGYVLVTGSTSGTLNGVSTQGGQDAFLSRWSVDGQWQWTRLFGGSSNERGSRTVSAPNGGLYMVGQTGGSVDGGVSAGSEDMFLVRFSANGTKEWSTMTGGSGIDSATWISVDANNNLFIVGSTSSPVLHGQVRNSSVDMFVSKWTANGTRLWTRLFGTRDDNEAFAVEVDSQGNALVCGYLTTANQLNDVAVLKLNSDSTLLWSRVFGSSGDDKCLSMAVDSLDRVFITGYAGGSVGELQNEGGNDLLVSMFDPDGTRVWTRLVGSPNDDAGASVSLDMQGNAIFVGGGTFGNPLGLVNFGAQDMLVSKWSMDNGSLVWARLYGGSAGDICVGVVADNLGTVFVTGYTLGSMEGLPNAGGIDYVLSRYNCLPNRAFNGTGSSCSVCSDGFYCRGAEPALTACSPGRFSNVTGATSCSPCPFGQYQPESSQVECITCRAGTYFNGSAASSENACRECRAGEASAERGVSKCLACVKGKFQSASGQLQCLDCEPGRFQNETLASSCSVCDAGRFVSESGADKCSECPFGRYTSTDTGFSQCQGCRRNEYAVRVSNGLPVCVSCPEHAICDGGGTVVVVAGYWGSRDETGQVRVYACREGLCLGENQCAASRLNGSMNPLCASCEYGLYEWGGECVKCDETAGARVFGIILAVLILVLLLHLALTVKAEVDYSGSVIKILVFFVQSAAVFVGSEALRNLPFLGFFNLDIFSGGQCYTASTPMERKMLGYLAPFICLSSVTVISAVHKLLTRFIASCDRWLPAFDIRHYYRTILAVVILNYNVVATISFEYLDCESYAFDGATVRLLHSSPSVDCGSSEYKRFLPLVAVMLVYVAGTPLLLLALLIYFQRRLNRRLSDGNQQGPLVEFLRQSYKRNFYWWEVYSITRRVTFVALAVFTRDRLHPQQSGLALLTLLYLVVQLSCRPFAELNSTPKVVGFLSFRSLSPNTAETLGLVLLASLACFRNGVTEPNTPGDDLAISLIVLPFAIFLIVWWIVLKAPHVVAAIRKFRTTTSRPNNTYEYPVVATFELPSINTDDSLDPNPMHVPSQE